MTQSPRRHGSSTNAVLGLVILTGLALRLFRLGDGSIWYDEGVSLMLAGKSITDLIAHTAGDIHPPLYYLLLHLWLQIAGNSQFAAAFFSLFCGVLLIPATFLPARRLLGEQVGLLAALLVAVSPYHLWYSQEMRMYTLGALLGVLSFYFLLRGFMPGFGMGPRRALATTPPPSAGEGESKIGGAAGRATRLRSEADLAAMAGFVAYAALGLYSLYYFAFLLLFENLAVLAIWLATRRGGAPAVKIKAWLAAQAAVVLLYLPWLLVFARQATEPPVPPWRGFTGLAAVLGQSWAALALGQSVDVAAVTPLLLFVGVLVVVALAESDGLRATGLLLAYTFVPVLAIYLFSLATPLFHVRYVFLYAPAFAIVLAQGILSIRRRSAALATLALAVLLLGSLRSAQAYYSDPAYAADDHRSAVAFIAEHARPGDAVLIDAGYAYPTFDYYYGAGNDGEVDWQGRLSDYACDPTQQQSGVTVLQTGSIDGSPSLGWGSPGSDFYATSEEETAAKLQEVARCHPRLWLMRIYDTVTDPQGFIRDYLNRQFLPIEDAGFGGPSSMRVQGYRTRRTPETTVPALPAGGTANFSDQVQLAGRTLPGELYPGETGYLTTYWQAKNARPDLRAFISLVDQSGREWAHWDEAPGGRLNPSSRWQQGEVESQTWRLDVPPGTPPGEYRLQAGLYDGASGRRLDVLDAAGRSLGTQAAIADVQVGRQRQAVDIDALTIRQRLEATLGGEARLLGYDLASRLAQPGGRLDLNTYWQGIKPADGERMVFVQLVDDAGKVWAAWEGPPSAAWQTGEVRRDQHSLALPADAPDGELHLILGIYDPASGRRLAVDGGLLGQRGDHLDLGKVRVAGRNHVFTAPPTQYPLSATFGQSIALLGYDRLPAGQPPALQPGEALSLALYWQCLEQMDVSYTVFVQLQGIQPQGAGNRLAGQDDALPAGGLAPTTSWVKGEVITDRHTLTIRLDATPGEYRLVVGWYDAASGARLPVYVQGVRQPGDMLVLETVTVR